MAKRKKKDSLPQKPWALLAYIAGDNNLSEAGLEDIKEMCEVGSSDVVHAAVQIDTEGEFDGVVRYEISKPDATGEAHRVVIERLAELDSGDPGTLRASLKWAFNRYSARRRVVVIWNHGAGFRTRLPRRDIAYDDSGTALDMNEIDGVFDGVGVGPQNRISILGFDACLMNMVEIVHHLRRRAEYIVGSEQTEPGDGWPYDRVLSILNGNPSASATAKQIVSAYISSYRSTGEQNVTQSAVDSSATEPVMAALSKLGDALAASFPGTGPALRMVRTRVQSYEYADYVDLGHLCSLLGKTVKIAGVKTAASAVSTKAAAAVIANGKYGPGVINSSGLSVWFPSDPQLYLNFRAKYVALDFAKNYLGWVNFLDSYHSA
jgi:hypothetical protein